MALGNNIKLIRESQGLSQDELSELTDGKVSQGAISALEKRDSTSSRYAPDLAKALGVELNLLLGEGDNAVTQEIAAHIEVLRRLPDYARSEVIKDAIKTAELIAKAKADRNGTKK